jgi:hypothetical protein
MHLLLTDDEQVKTLLVAHNKTTPLEPNLNYPGGFRQHVCWKDADFFYCASHYWGYENAEDNGYVAILLPRSEYSSAQAAEMFQEHMNAGRDYSRPDDGYEMDCQDIITGN